MLETVLLFLSYFLFNNLIVLTIIIYFILFKCIYLVYIISCNNIILYKSVNDLKI